MKRGLCMTHHDGGCGSAFLAAPALANVRASCLLTHLNSEASPQKEGKEKRKEKRKEKKKPKVENVNVGFGRSHMQGSVKADT